MASQSNGMTFALYLATALESTDFNTTQAWIAIFSYIFIADIYFLLALGVRKKEEDGELWVFLKFQELPLKVSLVHNTS